MKRIPVAGPSITKREIRYVTDAVTRAWYHRAGMYHVRFESAFADYVGSRYAVSLPSCTSAIHLSLLALGVGKGDEVIVPDLTWIATSAPVSYVGATPVFADVDSITWCLSVPSLRKCITPRTKAIVPVDLYGGMPDMRSLRAVARKHGIPIIEDAAEALGSEYRGRKAGSFGATGVFSFHGSKTLTTGEGGMLVTNSRGLHERIQILRDHGRIPGDVFFFNSEVAYKYKMTSMQAALGLAQLERVEELLHRKREIFEWYQEELGSISGLVLNAEPPGVRNSFWMTTVLWPARWQEDKRLLMERLKAAGIDSRPFFHPLSSLPAYATSPQARRARKRNAVAYDIAARGLNLPSPLSLTRSQVRRVARELQRALDL